MNWDIVALVCGSIGGIGSLIIFFTYLKTEGRKKRAEARLLEAEGDIKSLDYFKETIDRLVADNIQLNLKIDRLQREVDLLVEGRSDLLLQLERYKKAAKKMDDCPNKDNCPMAAEYHRLIEKG